jgi:hypothetical protein
MAQACEGTIKPAASRSRENEILGADEEDIFMMIAR